MHGTQLAPSNHQLLTQEVQVAAEVQFWQGEVQSKQVEPLSQCPAMQVVQMVPLVEQFWQGEVQSEQLEPLSHLPELGSQEAQAVWEVEQVKQGAWQGRQEVPTIQCWAMQVVHVVTEVEQLTQGETQGSHVGPPSPALIQVVQLAALVTQVAHGLVQAGQLEPLK